MEEVLNLLHDRFIYLGNLAELGSVAEVAINRDNSMGYVLREVIDARENLLGEKPDVTFWPNGPFSLETTRIGLDPTLHPNLEVAYYDILMSLALLITKYHTLPMDGQEILNSCGDMYISLSSKLPMLKDKLDKVLDESHFEGLNDFLIDRQKQLYRAAPDYEA